MKLDRKWVTPLMAGGFLLIAVTGVVLFFHVSTSFAKWSHEWLGMALIAVAVAHLFMNWRPLKQQVKTKIGAALMVILTVTTIVSLVPIETGSSSAPPFIAPMNALSKQPLTTLASLSNHSIEEVKQILTEGGISVSEDSQTLSSLTQGNSRQQMDMLGKIFKTN